MSRDLKIKVDVDQNGIPGKIERAIEDGIKDAASKNGDDSIYQRGKSVAKESIRTKGAVYKGELIESFRHDSSKSGGGRRVTIKNVSDHAAPMEFGAEYGARGPPIKELLPWVRTELSDWDVSNYWVALAAVHLDLPIEEWNTDEGNYVTPTEFSSEMENYGKAYWLHLKIKRDGIEAREFMLDAERYLMEHADSLVADNIDEALNGL